ncbi:HET domain-containing protein [Fusarium sp. Ph1]|nr:HET domain-containing protein [Fusarium sp. Ph1]
MSGVDASSTAEESRIEKLLKDLGIHLEQDAKSQQKQLLTFDNPHSCEKCQDHFIQIVEWPMNLTCSKCRWAGIGIATSPEYRSCGGCGDPFGKDVQRKYSAAFKSGLGNAVAAARSGCLLYAHLLASLGSFHWLVRALEKHCSGGGDTVESLLGIATFHLSGTTRSQEGVPERFVLSLHLRAGSYECQLYSRRLQAWAMPGDGASKFIESRPYECDVNSNTSWDFARRCLDTCRAEHSRCRERLTDVSDIRLRHVGEGLSSERIDIANIPSRLLDVQAGTATRIKLIKVSTLSHNEQAVLCSSGFVALSYCWGGQQSLILAKSQSQHLYGGFSSSELPNTIQDAVRVVREIGLRYLWVDALCIQQDSDQDKAAEISRMETYYGSATVTICAAASWSAEQGFLFRRKSHPFAVGPFRLSLRGKNGTDEGHIYLLEEADAPPQPTTTRGWTMQESFLSRRILIYSERQLYWTCTTSTCGCGGDLVSMEPRVSGNFGSLVDFIQPIGDLVELPPANQWKYLLMNYTTRHISVPSDKLLAISALVSHIWEVSEQRGEKPAYIAGLFVDLAKSTSLLEQLRWNTLDPAKSRRASIYRAPSWSWAAIDGPIRNHLSGAHVTRQSDEAVIHSYSVDLVHQNLPFGSVSGAHMVAEAKMRPLCECSNVPALPPMIRPGGRDHDDKSPGIDLLPDTEEDSQAMEEIIQKKGASGGESSLLLFHASRGLIVSPTASGDMVRIGVFEIHERGLDESDRGIIFKTCVPASVRLV